MASRINELRDKVKMPDPVELLIYAATIILAIPVVYYVLQGEPLGTRSVAVGALEAASAKEAGAVTKGTAFIAKLYYEKTILIALPIFVLIAARLIQWVRRNIQVALGTAIVSVVLNILQTNLRASGYALIAPLGGSVPVSDPQFMGVPLTPLPVVCITTLIAFVGLTIGTNLIQRGQVSAREGGGR